MDRRSFLLKAGVAGAAASSLAAPAVAQGKKEMTIVSSWPRDFPGLGTSSQRLAKRITELSEGRIEVQYYAAGERVGALDVFDDVASGNSQAYITADYYWIGKHPSFAYFTAVPLGMTTPEWTAWMKYRGGQALYDELAGSFGLKNIACGSTSSQAGGWFTKEINSVDDLQGLKMRIPGIGGTVMSKLGVSTVTLPGGQIYENLVSGAIDATEWVGPYNDYFMKFYEAAQYYYTGGLHEPSGTLTLGMNADWWGSLSAWEQAIVTAACNEEVLESHAESIANNGTYLTKLVEEQGVKVRAFTDDVWDEFGYATEETFEEVRQHSPLAAKIDDSFQANLRELAGMMKNFETTFTVQRNRVLGL